MRYPALEALVGSPANDNIDTVTPANERNVEVSFERIKDQSFNLMVIRSSDTSNFWSGSSTFI